MKSVDRLDVIEFTAERPDPAKRVKTYPHPIRLELIRFGAKSRDRELVAKKAELSKPVIH